METKAPLDPSDILTPQQLAERLQVKPSWIYEMTRERHAVRSDGDPLPCLRVGRYLRFNWPDVCEWLQQSAKRS